MVCVCCEECPECPNFCSFDMEVSLVDSIGTSDTSATPASCTGCLRADGTDVQFYGSNVAQTLAQVPGSNSPSGSIFDGSGRADEATSGGGVLYNRFGSIFYSVGCDSSKKWKIVAQLGAQSFQGTEPFVPGKGFQKVQQTDAAYNLEVLIGCADSTDEIILIGDEDGVTINGTLHSWVVTFYTESCNELDDNQDYQDCEDYLPIVIPTVTMTISRRAGC